MAISYISPLSNLEAELKLLFSNQYMLAFFKKFCFAIQSRMWRFKKARNTKYEAGDFLRVFFYSEITGKSIRSASERLNRYFLSKKKGRQKFYADGRKKREVPHQTDVNKYLRRIGLNGTINILREYLFWQLKETLELNPFQCRFYALVYKLFSSVNALLN